MTLLPCLNLQATLSENPPQASSTQTDQVCDLLSRPCFIHSHKLLDFQKRMQVLRPASLSQQHLTARQAALSKLNSSLKTAPSAHQRTARLQAPSFQDLQASSVMTSDGFLAKANETIASLQGLLDLLQHAFVYSIITGLQCMAAMQTDGQICSVKTVTPNIGFRWGCWLKAVVRFGLGSIPHMQPSKRLAHLIAIRKLRRAKIAPSCWNQAFRHFQYVMEHIPTVPSHELECIGIVLGAFCIGIVSLTYPRSCCVTTFSVIGLALFKDSPPGQQCWRQATAFAMEHAASIAWRVESIIWAHLLRHSREILVVILYLAVLNASMHPKPPESSRSVEGITK